VVIRYEDVPFLVVSWLYVIGEVYAKRYPNSLLCAHIVWMRYFKNFARDRHILSRFVAIRYEKGFREILRLCYKSLFDDLFYAVSWTSIMKGTFSQLYPILPF
jgi:hypothetical protein